MKIVKRNGQQVDFNPNKIYNRIKKQAENLKVNFDEIFIKVTSGIADGMSTKQLDDLIAITSESLCYLHYDYSKFAGNICISRHHKETEESYIKTIKKMKELEIIDDRFYDLVKEHRDKIQSALNYDRDYIFDYFGWNRLKSIYLIKDGNTVIERPQHMYMRVALNCTYSIDEAIEYYNELSVQGISKATPIMINSGTNIGQLASCFDENTEVYIHEKGMIPIKDVKIGDCTITHNNNLKKITNVWINELLNRDVVKFKTYRTNSITSTINHEFYSITKEQLKWNMQPKFNKLENLMVGDYIKSCKYEGGNISSETIDLYNVIKDTHGYNITCDDNFIYIESVWEQNVHNVKEKVLNKRGNNKINRYLIIDQEMSKFIGHWYGDGSVIKRYGKIRGISVVAHVKQTEIHDSLRLVMNRFGVPLTEYTSKHTKNSSEWLTFKINSNLIGVVFEKLFGSYFDGKKIPKNMYEWDKNLFDSFLTGLINSDGCIAKNLDITIAMKNEEFIKNMSIIAKRHGYCTGYTKTNRGLFRLDFGRNEYLRKISSKKYDDNRLKDDHYMNKNSGFTIKINDEYYNKIINKELLLDYNKKFVYNLEVEDDHSYTVEGIIAKNCNLSILKNDTTDGLLKSFNNLCISSSKAEGIGLAVSNMRSKKSPVGKEGGLAGGVLKYLKIINDGLRFWNQRGKRPGMAAIYIETWHKDVLDVIELKLANGKEENRARDLFTAMWISDNFMRAVKNDSDWYLFCPYDIAKAGLKPFYEIYGTEFEEEYDKAVALGIGEKVKAKDIWLKILESQMETGVPYMTFKDHANNKSNHKNIGTIKCSNLCSEVMQFSSIEDSNNLSRTSICTLSSVPLQKCIVNGEFDHNLLFKRVRLITRSLNKIVDINKYSTLEGELGGKEQRALGIGIQGLADTFAILGYNFISDEAKKLNKEIAETIYFAAMSSSNELAQETGLTYDYYNDSPISKGIFQFEMWDNFKQEDLSGRWDWEALRTKILKHGVRNSLVTNQMPTASSAAIIGSNEAFEPFNSNLYTRNVNDGEYIVVNKYLVQDLEKEGLWNDYLAKELVARSGSIVDIPVIPDYIKERYKTVYEMPQSKLIEMSADRALFVDGSQSLNIFISNPTVGKLTSSHFKSWELGLKTGMYYLRSKPVEFKGKHLALGKNENVENTSIVSNQSDFECDGCSA